jgi:hypothetical protein
MLPDGYLVRMSSTGYEAIPDPVDGVVVSNGLTDQNVLYGVGDVWFQNLNANTAYYFKVFGYTYTVNGIDYKTDGEIIRTSQTTQP